MRKISVAAKAHLQNIIIPFWTALRDNEYGGYYGYMDQELNLDKTAEKGCILNSRILWFFSEAAMLLESEELREHADHAYAFLNDHCMDRVNGGIFWSTFSFSAILSASFVSFAILTPFLSRSSYTDFLNVGK